jgi:hypothetical protein
MTKDQIIDYLNQGGKYYTVTNFDTIRDGGTKEVTTTIGNFYISKEGDTVHVAYPTNPTNVLSDGPSRAYFLERLSKFSLDLRFKVDGIANLINFNLNPNETTKSEV